MTGTTPQQPRLALKSTKETNTASLSTLQNQLYPSLRCTERFPSDNDDEEETYEHHLAFYHQTLVKAATSIIPDNKSIHDLLAHQHEPILAGFKLFNDYHHLFNETTHAQIVLPMRDTLRCGRCTRKDREEFPGMVETFFAFIKASGVEVGGAASYMR